MEDDILNYIRKGRASFLDKHREAQRNILDKLDQNRIYLREGKRIKAENIENLKEVNTWSKFETLSIIYNGLINETGDVFDLKSRKYAMKSNESSNRAAIRIQEDFNQDGDFDDEGERRQYDVTSTRMVRR